jgi:hypothetical protein
MNALTTRNRHLHSPVGPSAPGMTAGPSFEMYRTGYILPHRHAAWVVIHERLLDLAANCVSLNTIQLSTPTKEIIVYVEENLRQLAAALAQHIDR